MACGWSQECIPTTPVAVCVDLKELIQSALIPSSFESNANKPLQTTTSNPYQTTTSNPYQTTTSNPYQTTTLMRQTPATQQGQTPYTEAQRTDTSTQSNINRGNTSVDQILVSVKPETVTGCGQPPKVDHATRNAGGTSVGSRRTYTCEPGYIVKPQESSSFQIVCQANGSWTGIQMCKVSEIMTQWGKSVIKCSVYYATKSHSCKQALKWPDVYPRHTWSEKAFQMGKRSTNHFIEVGFATSVYITGVFVYESLRGGGVKSISARGRYNNLNVLWKTDTVKVLNKARIFKPSIKMTSFKSYRIKLVIDCKKALRQIDAIKLQGRK